jgi:hypothetical protein
MSFSGLAEPGLEGARGAARDAGRRAAAQVAKERPPSAGVLGDRAERTGVETNAAGGAAVFVEDDNAEFGIAGQGLFRAGRYTLRLRAQTAEMGFVDAFRLILAHTDPGGRGPQDAFVVEDAGRLAGAAAGAQAGVNSDRSERHVNPL